MTSMTSFSPNNMTTPVDWFVWVDSLSNYTFITGFLFVLMMLFYYWVNGTNSDKLLTSTIVVALLATLLRAVNMIGTVQVGVFWGLVVVSVFYSVWHKN